jgi:hypothetical protein
MAVERKAVLDLVFKVTGEGALKKAEEALGRIEKKGKWSFTGDMAKGFGKVAVGLTAIAGVGAGVVNGLMSMGDEAAMLQAQMQAAHVQFGEAYASIDKWATKNANSFGMTSRELIGLSTSTQASLVQMGLSDQKAAGLTKTFGNLAGALSYASGGFYDTAATTDMIQAAFRGEYDALQRLIPGVSDARIKAVALQIAHKDGKKAVDGYSTSMAILGILQRDGKRYVDLYNKSQDSALVSMNKSKAAMREQWQEMEVKLLPGFVKLWSSLSTKATPAIKDFIDYLGSDKGQKTINDFTNAMSGLGGMLGGVAQSLIWATNEFIALDRWIANSNPLAIGLTTSLWDLVDALNAAHTAQAQTSIGTSPVITGAVGSVNQANQGHLNKSLNRKLAAGAGGSYGGIDWNALNQGTGSGGSNKGGSKASKSKYDDPDLEHLKTRVQKNLDAVNKAFDKHKAALDDLKQKYADVSGSVQSSFLGASITGRGKSYAEMRASMGESLARGGSMLSALKKLKAMGLSNELLSQLAQEGPGALEQAVAIMQSGKGGVAALNAQYGQLAAISKQAGAFIGDTLYAASIKAETKATDKLQKSVTSLEKSIKSLENQIKHGGNITQAQAAASLRRLLKQAGALGVPGVKSKW